MEVGEEEEGEGCPPDELIRHCLRATTHTRKASGATMDTPWKESWPGVQNPGFYFPWDG